MHASQIVSMCTGVDLPEGIWFRYHYAHHQRAVNSWAVFIWTYPPTTPVAILTFAVTENSAADQR